MAEVPDPGKACRKCDYPAYVEQLQRERDRPDTAGMTEQERGDTFEVYALHLEMVVERLREALQRAPTPEQVEKNGIEIYRAWYWGDGLWGRKAALVASPDKPPEHS